MTLYKVKELTSTAAIVAALSFIVLCMIVVMAWIWHFITLFGDWLLR